MKPWKKKICVFWKHYMFFFGSMWNFGGVRGVILVTCVTDLSVGGESRLREDIMKVHESCRFKSVSWSISKLVISLGWRSSCFQGWKLMPHVVILVASLWLIGTYLLCKLCTRWGTWKTLQYTAIAYEVLISHTSLLCVPVNGTAYFVPR